MFSPVGRPYRLIPFALFFLWASGCSSPSPAPKTETAFQPNWASIQTHKSPAWYNDAKFGIFVHWGLYSVARLGGPVGRAPQGRPQSLVRQQPIRGVVSEHPSHHGSPTQKHHFATYGKNFDYLDFIPKFNEEIAKWNPDAMAGLFSEVGAKYVVLTTKHHDGFTLWPSKVVNPKRRPDRQHASRDLVGDLTKAVNAKGMRMGLYYSGGLDWSFTLTPITTEEEVREHHPYRGIRAVRRRAMARAHCRLSTRHSVERYRLSEARRFRAYFRRLLQRFPDGLVNDRFETGIPDSPKRHHDIVTPEYQKMDAITDYKWETCRGLGYSFGYNQLEGPKQTLGEKR